MKSQIWQLMSNELYVELHIQLCVYARWTLWQGRRARWTLLQERLSIERNSAQLLDDELSSGLITDSCTTSWPVSLFLSLKSSDLESGGTGEGWRLGGLRNGTGDRARWCLLKLHMQLVSLLVFPSCASIRLSLPSFITWLQTWSGKLALSNPNIEYPLPLGFPFLCPAIGCSFFQRFSQLLSDVTCSLLDDKPSGAQDSFSHVIQCFPCTPDVLCNYLTTLETLPLTKRNTFCSCCIYWF